MQPFATNGVNLLSQEFTSEGVLYGHFGPKRCLPTHSHKGKFPEVPTPGNRNRSEGLSFSEQRFALQALISAKNIHQDINIGTIETSVHYDRSILGRSTFHGSHQGGASGGPIKVETVEREIKCIHVPHNSFLGLISSVKEAKDIYLLQEKGVGVPGG